ncbi:PREDICTED: protein NUCLEAR FUSION DEFECTIVE 4-like [Tarenaya hassleriana]|uniref:protein NUCLEAR FUSION DEFECTIVE 4-like n=1 Tax=Tarenaya hassleriana TaxID=28532 RepID=UPI00053C5EEF|nr:PREDICTED: protein NUCLEAR FUSION DEFECTIVE 4-like [Tarenaya hassleriana]
MLISQWRHRFEALVNDRWLVFVCAMWVQSVAGVGYIFGGSMSPAIKTALGYDQRQISVLGVAKNLGDAIGFVSGALSEAFPPWVVLLVGAAHNLVGYGVVWLVVSGLWPRLPLWMLFIAIFLGTNGETYYNTASLVSCIQNFPDSRGPVVGILKGFSGLSGAILTQVYSMFNPRNDSSVILMVAIGPPIVVLALLFIVRPVEGHGENRPSDNLRFLVIYGFCSVLAVYLLGILILQNLFDLTQTVITIFGAALVILMVVPLLIPVASVSFCGKLKNATLEKVEGNSDVVDENEEENLVESSRESLPPFETRERRKQSCIGENFTLLQALREADFWLIFFSLILGVGSGITVIDNLGQICYSLGYTNTKIFVSIISIFNFLGRVAGGYFSELIMRKLVLPRPLAMSVVQAIMAFGLAYYAIDCPGKIYVVTILTGMGYGAHWAIAPASVSDLFGLKSFGSLYNFQIVALPIGSFVFSGLMASNIYDYFARKQAGPSETEPLVCVGSVCYSVTCGIMSVVCLVAVVLSLTVVFRTRRFYLRLHE